MKLYIMSKKTGFIEVEIVKETPKQYTIGGFDYREVIKKSEIGTIVSHYGRGYAFGVSTDKEELTEMWNSYIDKEIISIEKELELYKGLRL